MTHWSLVLVTLMKRVSVTSSSSSSSRAGDTRHRSRRKETERRRMLDQFFTSPVDVSIKLAKPMSDDLSNVLSTCACVVFTVFTVFNVHVPACV